MKKRALRLAALCLALMTLLPYAVADTVQSYTVAEKWLKQLQAGSGFTGTLTVQSQSAEGRQSAALTTLKPIVLDLSYLFTREDLAAKTPAESRVTLALVDGEKTLGEGELVLRKGELYGQSTLTGDSWYSLSQTAGAGEAGLPEGDALNQAVATLLSRTAVPGLAGFAAGLLTQLHDLGTDAWGDTLEPYTTKIDLWIEGYRQKAVLGKMEDGTTTMAVAYQIPQTAVKAQLKQLVLDMLTDQALLPKLIALLPDGQAAEYLNPARQAYYFYAIDQLPLDGEMTIARTVSLKGETLALSLALPFYDSQSGAVTLRYDRHRGEGDLPDENTIELRSGSLLLKADYQRYQTLTGATVYQGTLLREPLGAAAFEVGIGGTDAASLQKTLSAAFTLSLQHTDVTDDQGKQTQTTDMAVTLMPEYTPDVAGDEPTDPTEAQSAQYLSFAPLDVQLSAAFSSGQAKNASTSVTINLTLSGDQSPQTVTLAFAGKTRAKWTPEALDTTKAIAIHSLDAPALTALLGQANVRGGLLLLPYLGLPATAGTAIPAVSQTPAP